ncbi:GspMb/PilO family protein [Prosthecobacter dejongeii]|uniref:General secretion pathway protein M n=1 Tax=Prosthecobacter dejongeii TaxID=48465 RepID=A0A7W7YPR1_9BACT|nr:GspMb/PilO family protein [Prosthecobacter dejongeii]MBB5040096.1 hypothetical protein [Prosthecobacter dejongeii]
MAQKLTSREKNLLLACVGVLVFMVFAILVNTFLGRRSVALQKIATLQAQKSENDTWMADRAFWEKRRAWLVEKMPTTESLGRAQGQLLEDLQNQALEFGFTTEQPTLPPLAAPNENYREVTVSVRLRGDQTMVLQWLATLQSPEKFQAVRQLEVEIDTRSREKTPQVVCNLTLARWFKPELGL